jgi:hypothetical protein
MKTMWIVMHGEYENTEPLAVFDDRDAAEKVATNVDGVVREVFVNPTRSGDFPDGKTGYCVEVYTGRKFKSYSGPFDYFSEDVSVADGEIVVSGAIKFNEPKFESESRKGSKKYTVYVWAEDWDDAVRQAEELVRGVLQTDKVVAT